MDQSELAASAGISVETIKRLEKIDGPLLSANGKTIVAIQAALETAGVEFIEDGVRLKR